MRHGTGLAIFDIGWRLHMGHLIIKADFQGLSRCAKKCRQSARGKHKYARFILAQKEAGVRCCES
jgi:hypothetical protein